MATGKDMKESSKESEDGPLMSEETLGWMETLMRSMGLKHEEKPPKPDDILPEFTLDGIVKYIEENGCSNIITMAGAGISTSAGIPDFRSPGSGLYDNLQKYDLPSPQAIFEIEFFKEHPEPFFDLARQMWPGKFKPTPCHYFIRKLEEKNLLLRHFTQNIDTLEHVSGLTPGRIIEAHGSFHTAHCISCKKEYSQQWIKREIFAQKTPTCEEDDCVGLVKPDIVFFGEKLPDQFFHAVTNDIPKCDLLIILGTSLVVQPFASLVSRVSDNCPRLYINMEKPAGSNDPMMSLFGMGHGFHFDSEDNYRDVFWEGTCDDGCIYLAEKLGWKEELLDLIKTEHYKIDSEEPAGSGAIDSNNSSDGKTIKDGKSSSL